MIKTKEISNMGVEELETKLNDLRKTYSREYVKTKVGSQSEKAVNISNIKKDIARVLTVLSSKRKK